MASSVQGVAELVGRCKALPDKIRKQGLRKAMTAGARPIVTATKNSVSTILTGLLKQSIGSVVLQAKDPARGYIALIGERRLKGVKKKGIQNLRWVGKKVKKKLQEHGIQVAYPARYAHLIEKGTKRARARPFALPGLQRGSAQAQAAIQESLTTFIEAVK